MSYVLKRKFHKKGYINNFFTVGTPTFEGNLASGFSTANYLETPKFPTNVTDLEMVWKVKFSAINVTQFFFNTAPYYSCLIGLESSKFKFWLSNNTTTWDIECVIGTTTIVANTWYYVKFTYDGETYKLFLSTDNKTWNLEASSSSTKTIGVNHPVGRIGHGYSDNPATNTTFDLSECFIKINGELWWQPYKRCKYDYNFTRVGTPSISNAPSCEVSGFSTSNYIKKELTFDINGDWEVVTRAYLNGLASGGPTSMLFGITKGNTFGINFYVSSTAVRLAYNHTPNSGWTYTDISVSVPTDRWFYIKYVKTGTTFTFYFSEDGELFEEMGSYTYTSTLYEVDGFAIGCGYSQTALPSTAMVDLTQTTVKINNEPIWSCFKQTNDVVFKEDGTSDDYDFFDYKNYVLKRKFYKKGYINNFTTVGTPTFNGSVVSGFSTSNYLRLPQTPDFSTLDSWEWAFKITTGTGTSDQQLVGGLSIERPGVEIGIISSKLKLWLGSISGSGHDISTNNAVIGTYAIATSTDYWIKLSFTGTKYILSISENGVSYTDDITIESTLRTRSENLSIGVDKYGSNRPFLGSMDLSECYIKSNGEYLWNPYKRCKYDYNFTTVGTLNISNEDGTCEVSGFSTSAGCVIEDSFAPVSGDTWAMDFKVRTGSNVSTRQQILGGVNASYDGIEFGVDGAKWICWLGTGSSYDLASEKKGTYTVMANTDYWFRVTYDGENYTFYYSTDGVEYIQDIQVASTSIIKSGVKSIGFDKSQSSNPWLGSIDLTQSYIKINGELWWSCFKQTNEVAFKEDGTLEDYDFFDYKNYVLKAPSKKYYKYVPWEQPTLTSNTSSGTVSSTNYNSSHPPYVAFDGTKANGTNKYLSQTGDGGDITWETPEPIKITSCEIYTTTEGSYLNRFPQTITIYGSDGGVDWVKIGSLSGYEQPASGGFVTVPCNASKTYRYTKWEFGVGFSGSNCVGVSEIVITADKVVPATYKDYDFYEIEVK